jgi:hypothetical protein
MTAFKWSRRGALVCGGGAILLASTGGALRVVAAAGRPAADDDAYAPWRLWDDPAIAGTPLALVAAGVLAANPHDTQPWLFAVGADAIEIFADRSRGLGAMDAYRREMQLGLGCAIENMIVAAGPNGFAAAATASPGSLSALDEGEAPVHAATLRLTRRESTAPDPLYRAIPLRHTNRYAYERGRAPPQDWRDFAASADFGVDVRVFLIADGEPRRLFNAAVVEGTQAIIADRTMIADSDRWFRSSSAEIDAHRDGPTLEAAGLPFLTLTFARFFPVSTETSHRAWLGQTRDVQLASAPLVGLIAVRDRADRASAIAAGRAWQRLHLRATAQGLAMQPLNQPIEMIDRERRAGRGGDWAARMARLTGEDWQATFSFRAGFASQAAPASPRRRLKDVLTG